MEYRKAKTFILNKLRRELSDKLHYHGVHHTLDVLKITIELCKKEKVSRRDTILLKTAALYHDSGFTISNLEHEKSGCTIARNSLHRFGYTEDEIEKICGMIMATKIPQSPKTFLEEILCDADLDYLGRTDFFEIGETLFNELKAYNIVNDEQTWNQIQIAFLENHNFWTETNIARRDPQKMKYLKQLKKIVADYKKN